MAHPRTRGIPTRLPAVLLWALAAGCAAGAPAAPGDRSGSADALGSTAGESTPGESPSREGGPYRSVLVLGGGGGNQGRSYSLDQLLDIYPWGLALAPESEPAIARPATARPTVARPTVRPSPWSDAPRAGRQAMRSLQLALAKAYIHQETGGDPPAPQVSPGGVPAGPTRMWLAGVTFNLRNFMVEFVPVVLDGRETLLVRGFQKHLLLDRDDPEVFEGGPDRFRERLVEGFHDFTENLFLSCAPYQVKGVLDVESHRVRFLICGG